MAELCTAFSRIVPRYQFSTNHALFVIEDMKDAPIPKSNGGYYFRGVQNKRFHSYNSYCSNMDTCNNLNF